jgi:hypothetical protein
MSSARLAAARFLSYTRIACAGALAVGAVTVTLASVPAAGAAVHQSSARIALIPQNGPVPPNGPDGIMPTSAYVSGRPNETFGRFSFSNLAPGQITTSSLSQFDTVALIQVSTSSLSATAKAALAQFVAGGGKLIIHDSDETKLNDYSWLLPGPYTTRVGAGCQGCGGTSGTSTITNSSLISSNPADPSYVNTADLMQFTDAIGDANLLVSTDPRWFAVATGTNANVHNESGAQVAFANNNGLIVYNGFDTDFVKTTPSDAWRCNDAASGYHCPAGSTPTVDWIAHMWYSELVQPWGAASAQPGGPGANGGNAGGALPQNKSVAKVGATLAATPAGLPSNLSCVANRRLLLRLRNLAHLRHRKVVQVEVFVNGKRRLRERGRLVNVMLAHLPAHGRFTVEVIATTRQGYHLIAKRSYRAC